MLNRIIFFFFTGYRPNYRPGYDSRPGYNTGYPGTRPGYNQYRPGYDRPYSGSAGNFFGGYGDGYSDNFRTFARSVDAKTMPEQTSV